MLSTFLSTYKVPQGHTFDKGFSNLIMLNTQRCLIVGDSEA
jgi:hypothetical protein